MKKELYKNTDINDLEGEVWIDIEGYDAKYQISNQGRILSKVQTNRILKVGLNQEGYARIALRYNGIMKSHYIHRLVAIYFLPNPDDLPQVDHINTIRNDNRVENLKWVTPSKNNDNELTKKRQKQKKAGLTMYKQFVVQLNMDKTFVAIYYSASDAYKSTGIYHRNILKCCNGIQNSAGGYIWMFYKMK